MDPRQLASSALAPLLTGAPKAPPATIDCDDLPSLTKEEQQSPPHDVSLDKSTPANPPRYSVLPGVTMTTEAMNVIARIDESFHKRTGKRLVVTSGRRDAASQAKAMYKMLSIDVNAVGIYHNKKAATEIRQVFVSMRAAGKPRDEIVATMYETLQSQIARGVYLSAHLRAGAVDIRSRNMTEAERKVFEQCVAKEGDFVLLEESAPPHFHLQLEN